MGDASEDSGLEGVDDDQHTDAALPAVTDADLGPTVHRNAFRDTPRGPGVGVRIVGRAEFGEVPPGQAVTVLTWYQADEVLCDEQNKPVDNVSLISGELTPACFGGDSEDPNICLIINDALNLYLEIVRKEGSYADEVLNYGRPV